ncbi:hypothetical protein NT2_32_00020 [Caenibius tardaugens NBRC 16725]|uniref:Integrase catalytic domain-containing protein n=1 Tax=Caenibius tardaugens NBRC 16725 TaxID=1219035 RepID=U3A8W8_9SPHN|nr:transposase [Caenibius tardaugens]AZI35243.1 IS3 family transposase [Caenibius tardaugens NBRC 16725]GAD51208.1 hypothetical protein NT2_32_00020 [Caenibius tardaugens NBRC 16725]
MGKPNFSDEFKRDAVAQITERGYPVAEVSVRLGVSQHSLYAWKRQLAKVVSGDASKDAEIRQLKRELARVLIHSDQGSQFTSMDWAAFIRAHNLEHSMSRRGNCHDNAVAESFFSSLKRERIRRRTYKTREQARQDVFDYIEMFYNPVRKLVRNGMLSPAQFERRQILKAESV